jgi:membrane protease YdiL (CAAX protease family)
MDTRTYFIALFLLSALIFLSARYYNQQFAYVAAMHIGLLSAAMALVYGKDLRSFMAKMGIPGDLRTNAIYTIGGLAAVFCALGLLTLAFSLIGWNDQQKIVNVANSLPLPVLALAVLLAPFSEEMFFRGFLTARIGIVPSALIFGLFHFGYGSVVEIAGAMMIGLVFGLVFRKSGSIVPSIAVHMLYNMAAIFVLKGYS